MLRESRLEESYGTRQQHTTLICESGKESAHRIWRQLREMRRNHAPGALHHELNQKRSHNQPGHGGSVSPQRNNGSSQNQRYNHGAATPEAIGQKSEQQTSKDRSHHRNRGDRGTLGWSHSPVALEEGRKHILRAVRCEVHHHHQEREIEKQLPVRDDLAA